MPAQTAGCSTRSRARLRSAQGGHAVPGRHRRPVARRHRSHGGRGELPNLRRLAAEGAHGPPATIEPTNSALLWTSIATGRHHRDHGIDGFTSYRVLGLPVSRTTLRRARKLGLRHPIKWLQAARLLKRRMLDSRRVRCKTLWDIISQAGGRVVVVNWWHTWPADPVNGFLVSDRLHYWRAAVKRSEPRRRQRLTWPEELADEVQPLVVAPQEVDPDELRRFVNLSDEEFAEFAARPYRHHAVDGELRFLIAMDTTNWRCFRHCLDAGGRPALASVYFRVCDLAQHCAYRFMPTADELPVDSEDRRRYGGVVPQAYRMADDWVGKVLARMEPEDTLLVVSDHGFGYQPRSHSYGHGQEEPPGVIYAYGKEFVPGARIEGAGIYDVAPTVLRLCGLPVAEDMIGRPLEEAMTEEFRRDCPPPQPVKSYGARSSRGHLPPGGSLADSEVQEHLKALGYLE